MVDLEEYISAGYYVTSYVPRPSYVADTLPERILSGSDCICSFVPDSGTDSLYFWRWSILAACRVLVAP
jgi:hypothetical protein